MLKVTKAKKMLAKKKKYILLKGSKRHQNGSLDFWTSCPSLQSSTSPSKYLFYLVLRDVFMKLIRVFDGICIIMWKLKFL